jgi:hypothetical protein
MQLSCEVCHSPLRAEDVRLDLAVAKCHKCNAVYDLSGRKARGLPAQQRPRSLVRGRAVLPDHFRVEEDDSTTRISWRWFSWRHVLLAFGFLLMGVLAVLFYIGTKAASSQSLLLSILTLGYGGFTLWLAYVTLAGFLNRTTIEVNRTRLSIRHGPLPWPGGCELPGRELSQLYGQEVIQRNHGRELGSTYDLLALDRAGHKIELLSGLPERDQVLYLEQALERQLGIADAPVDGEAASRAVAF